MLVLQQHWGLRRLPFSDHPSGRDFFSAPVQEEALARLQYVVDFQRPVGVLLGESGFGKSTVLRMLPSRLETNPRWVACSGSDPCWEASVARQLNRPAPPDNHRLAWAECERGLFEQSGLGRHVVIAVDDAHRLGSNGQQALLRLQAAAEQHGGALTLLLAAESGAGELARWAMMSELRTMLEPWSPEDVSRFIDDGLQRAGAQRDLASDETAYRIWNWAGGSPRVVVQLVRRALLAGAGAGAEQFDCDLLDAAQQGLAVDAG